MIVRRVSQKKLLIETEEPSKVKSRSPSPARNAVSNIVHVRNLVRPFTVLQLKELLRRNGNLIEDQFWIDSIKSHCYATVSFRTLFQVYYFYINAISYIHDLS